MLEQGPAVIPANPAGPKALLGCSQYEVLATDARVDQLPLRALDRACDLVDQQVLLDDQADKDRSGGEPLRGRSRLYPVPPADPRTGAPTSAPSRASRTQSP